MCEHNEACNGDYWTDSNGHRIACHDKVMRVADKIRVRDAALLARLAR